MSATSTQQRRWSALAIGIVLLVTVGYLVARRAVTPGFLAAGDSVGDHANSGGTVSVIDDDSTTGVPVAAHITSISQPGLPKGLTIAFAVGDEHVPTGAGRGDARLTYAGHFRRVQGVTLHSHEYLPVARVITIHEQGTFHLGPARLTWAYGPFRGTVLVGETIDVTPDW